MFGILFAVLCAAGLYRLWRPRRFGPYGYAWASGGCGPYGGHNRFGRGGPGRLDWVIRKLDATPEQEKAIRQTADEVRSAFSAINPRRRLDSLAAALTGETVERERLRAELGDTTAATDAVLNGIERLRANLTSAQREKLAAMITRRGGLCC